MKAPPPTQDRLGSAVALHRSGRLADAAAGYRSLLSGDHALEARINLGALLDESGNSAEALIHYRQALELSPGNPLALFNQGNALMRLGRFAEAAQSFRGAVVACPEVQEAWLALGTALQGEGDLAGALEVLGAALERGPQNPEAHWYLALALLSAGRLSEGWREYEWRWQKASFTSPRRAFECPAWDGSPLLGRRILLHGEQGLGDTVQFIRYAPLVARLGGTVVAECQNRSLKPLLERVPGVAQVAVLGEELPPCELHLPLLSLPRVFNTTLDSIPAQVPYLSADPARLELWRQRMAEDARFKVGLVWSGRKYPDPFRSCPPGELTPLAAFPEVSFYSLQVGEAAPPPAELGVRDLTGHIGDFGDSAALVTLLDLVISVDTSVAHLAGALGKETFLLLPRACDWRWLREREDSPWYPTMRLFRQEVQGSWREPVQQLVGALHERLWRFLAQGAQREPFNGDRIYACGTFLAERGRDAEACPRFSKAALLKPGSWEPRYGLGLSLQRLGLLAQAQEAFAEGVALAGEVPLLHEALGVVLQMQGELVGAAASYRRALHLDPGALRSRYNLGTVCRDLGRFDEALECLDRVVRESPEHGEARWNRALLLLLQGDFRRGWREFSWRFHGGAGRVPGRLSGRPRWDGSSLDGRTVLLYAEQGLGDTVQFVRYAPLVAKLSGRVLLEVQTPSLRPLLQRLPGVSGVLAPGDTLPPFDLHASLMDLPAIFDTTPETVPPAPYLQADPPLVELWRSRMTPDGTLRVGLVWSGNPGHANDANRSVSLATLAPLAGIPGVTFYSLQLGRAAGQLQEEDSPLAVQDLTGHIRDFADTAAYLANLDLVITVDTCLAHLSGALGVPVWVLIPLVPDWRWLLCREDSPWYPTMRLFRQKERGEWGPVLAAVREALGGLQLRAPRGPAAISPAQGHKERGVALSEAGLHREAALAFGAALDLCPLDPETLNNLGSALAGQGRHLEAVVRYCKAISLDDRFVPPHYNMGNSLRNLGRTEEAIESYRRALALAPELVQGWLNLGLALQEGGEWEEARRALERALTLDPDYLPALHNLGELYLSRGELREAQRTLQEVVRRDPGYLSSWNALGIALQSDGKAKEAYHCFQRALALKPDYLHALNNLGTACKALGRVRESEECYRRLIELDPDYADAYWNLALVLLLRGEYPEGWRFYEWRFAKVDPIVRRELPQPLWDGSPLGGRAILLHAEQGFGDTIQFVRYATVVAARGGKVFLECQVPALKRLLATVPGVAGVVARGEALPPFEVHAPLMSLPHLCGTTLETIPAPVPYLAVPPQREALWRERLGREGFKVGIVWAGRRTYKDDRKRSLSLSLFAPLARVPGVRLFTLQVGDGADQALAPPEGMALTDCTGELKDFAESAALIRNLDLVISADTAVAHLAGALGVPVWVLIPYACDFRWLREREDSPWYPTARLFRQSEPGDWPGVLARVAQALRQLAEESSTLTAVK